MSTILYVSVRIVSWLMSSRHSSLVDVASNRKMLSLLLGKRKVRTEMAEDGADVVAMARTGSWPVPFQMIIMDNQMPKMVRRGGRRGIPHSFP